MCFCFTKSEKEKYMLLVMLFYLFLETIGEKAFSKAFVKTTHITVSLNMGVVQTLIRTFHKQRE
jgi:hypothetical protein